MKKLRAILLSLVVAISVLAPTGMGEVNAATKTKMSVRYAVHIQTYGDSQGFVKADQVAGTTEKAKRLEAIRIKLVPKTQIVRNSITYTTHCQKYGWLSWVQQGKTSGTTNEAKKKEM